MHRRRILGAALASAVQSMAAPTVYADAAFPNRPVRVVVPFAPGGAGDAIARVLGDRVQAELGQSIVVENKGGGNTVIGTQAVASARPDGYTLLQTTASNVIVAQMQENLPFDPDRAFSAVVGVGAVPLTLVVNARTGPRSIEELVAQARSRPGTAFYSSGGTGSQTHVAPAWFAQLAGMPATHVAFRGGGPAVQAVLAGQVQFTFASTIAVHEMVKGGQLRLLGVTSDRRLPAYPEVPSLVEQGFADFTPALWYGYVAPAGTPKPVIERLHAAFRRSVDDPAVHERLETLGLLVKVRGPGEFARFMQEESVRWGRVVRENRIKLE
ncbi:tripartite tricarboxylate transporter substrate binding protein [Xylophilus sp. GW821-FHT01B05]